MEKVKWVRSVNLIPYQKADEAKNQNSDDVKVINTPTQKKKWVTPTITGPYPIELQKNKHKEGFEKQLDSSQKSA